MVKNSFCTFTKKEGFYSVVEVSFYLALLRKQGTWDHDTILKSGTVCIEPSTGVISLGNLSKENLQ